MTILMRVKLASIEQSSVQNLARKLENEKYFKNNACFIFQMNF